MEIEVLAVFFAVVAGVTYYFSNKLNIKKKSYGHKMFSFSAGISITYVLLDLFPTFTEVAAGISKLLFLSIPIGFIIHHLIEKEIYLHNKKNELVKVLTLEENTFSFVYHILLGIVLVAFLRESLFQGILLFIPIILFTFVSTLPTKRHQKFSKAVFLASSTLFGTIIGIFWKHIPIVVEATFIGLVTGVLLFTVVRHHIPFGRKGKVSYFTLGFLIYAAIIVASWFI
ncbi:hypothetical protein HOI26_00865 [Candidatus Woesearchaeota archaeon]|nr:hypothetical protein [Candidatus Woesearchaeota archaeon]